MFRDAERSRLRAVTIRTSNNTNRDTEVSLLRSGTSKSISFIRRDGTFRVAQVGALPIEACKQVAKGLGWSSIDDMATSDPGKLRVRINAAAQLFIGRVKAHDLQWAQIDSQPGAISGSLCQLLLAIVTSYTDYSGPVYLPGVSVVNMTMTPFKSSDYAPLHSVINNGETPFEPISHDGHPWTIMKAFNGTLTVAGGFYRV
ncbi:hypothetical protein CF319_g8447 [Tilletia indica]|nr:hypothetical protein CF319_g8447 [Tilletia indica]